ncbi:hypothetical protein QAD02_015690 [Eretmocerus hayati]|uniref:Uncharacterized protein n=1 Tax=Eretmocerus hayati TaxID=131215 RepID=A0ACC2P9Z6_9HYME|nr:hypothetical protein QAD02_015690 [Eretmocerus hayati]
MCARLLQNTVESKKFATPRDPTGALPDPGTRYDPKTQGLCPRPPQNEVESKKFATPRDPIATLHDPTLTLPDPTLTLLGPRSWFRTTPKLRVVSQALPEYS